MRHLLVVLVLALAFGVVSAGAPSSEKLGLAGVPAAAAEDDPLAVWTMVVNVSTVHRMSYEGVEMTETERATYTDSDIGSLQATWTASRAGTYREACEEGQKGYNISGAGSGAGAFARGAGPWPGDWGLPTEGQEWTQLTQQPVGTYSAEGESFTCDGQTSPVSATQTPVVGPVFLRGSVEELNALPVGHVLRESYQHVQATSSVSTLTTTVEYEARKGVLSGAIIVELQTDPADNSAEFSFSGALAGSIMHGQTLSQTVEPGSYSVSEAAAPGWILEEVSCDDGDSSGDSVSRTATFWVDAGETVTCTFRNGRPLSYVAEYDYTVSRGLDGIAGIAGFDSIRVFGSASQLDRVSQVCVHSSRFDAGLNMKKGGSKSTVAVYWSYYSPPAELVPDASVWYQVLAAPVGGHLYSQGPQCLAGSAVDWNVTLYTMGSRDGFTPIAIENVGHGNVWFSVHLSDRTEPIVIPLPDSIHTFSKVNKANPYASGKLQERDFGLLE